MKNCRFLLLIILALLVLIGACSPQTTSVATQNLTSTPPGPGAYGFAPDYAWLKGQVLITAIQGGCTYLVYDPGGSDQYGGKVILSGNLKGLVDGQWVVVYGTFDNSGARSVCPGATFTYIVSHYDRQ
jgi:hypothetical protein